MAKAVGRITACLIVLMAAWLLPATCLGGTPARVLRVLAWPGYADADVVAAFEHRYGVRVDLTLIDSDEALRQKVRAHQGGDFDVFAVNTAELQDYIDRGLVQAVDPKAIPNTRRQLPRFRNLAAIAGLTRDGKAYGIPYTYSEMGLIYDRRQFERPPDSIAALWDPRLHGKVLAYNTGGHNFSLAAMMLGRQSPFHLEETDWPHAVERLIALRRNVLGFYTQPDEATQLFLTHHAALLFANYGRQQVQALKAAGADIGYVVPKEGALAWLDCWVIARGSKDSDLADAWIDYMLEPDVSALLVTRQGLANTLDLGPGPDTDERLIWLEPMEDVARREKLWQRIVSGDSLKRVLAQ